MREAQHRRHRTDEHVHGLAGRRGLRRLGPFLKIFCAINLPSHVELSEMQVRCCKELHRCSDCSCVFGHEGRRVHTNLADFTERPLLDNGVIKQAFCGRENRLVACKQPLLDVSSAVCEEQREEDLVPCSFVIMGLEFEYCVREISKSDGCLRETLCRLISGLYIEEEYMRVEKKIDSIPSCPASFNFCATS